MTKVNVNVFAATLKIVLDYCVCGEARLEIGKVVPGDSNDEARLEGLGNEWKLGQNINEGSAAPFGHGNAAVNWLVALSQELGVLELMESVVLNPNLFRISKTYIFCRPLTPGALTT